MPTELLVPERRSHPAWMPLTLVLVAMATVGVAGPVHRPRWELPPLPPPVVPGLELEAVVHVGPGEPVRIDLALTNETTGDVRVSVPAYDGAWDEVAFRQWAPGGGVMLTVGDAYRAPPPGPTSPPRIYDGTTRPHRPRPEPQHDDERPRSQDEDGLPPPAPPGEPEPAHGGRFTIEVGRGETVTGRARPTPWPEPWAGENRVASEDDVRAAPLVRVCILAVVTDDWRNLASRTGPPVACTDVVPRR